MAFSVKQIQWQLWILDLYDGYIDGIVGPLTNNGLEQFYNLYDPSRQTFEAISKELIKAIQSEVGAEEDGLGGCLTRKGIMDLQAYNGLHQSGKWDSATADLYPDVLNVEFDDSAPTASEPSKPSAPSTTGDFWDTIKYFKKDEFRCKCGGRYCNGFPAELNEKLIRIADEMRGDYDAPMTVSSGVRCERHNANVGGVSNSRHKLGKAMDFCVKGKTSAQIVNDLNRNRRGLRYFYAIDNFYVHMDVD